MTARSEIEAELAAVADIIGNARAALMRNEILEIKDVPGRMRDVADAITELPPEDASDMRPPLVELLSDFKSFAEELKSKIEEIETAKQTNQGAAATGQSGS
jgi:hypothetical protein